MRHFLLTVLALAAAVIVPARALEVTEIPNVHVADRTRFVSNPDGVLSAAMTDSLDRALASVWAATTAEPVVVAVASMPSDTDIDTYATDIFDLWGIGKKDRDNGVLIVIARDDRKAVIRTGRGAEGALPDVVCGRILRNEMFPRFKQGDYDGGTAAAVEAVRRVLTDPAYAAELRSAQPNDARAGEPDGVGIDVIPVLGVIAALMLVWAIIEVVVTRRDESVTRYGKLHRLLLPMGAGSFLTLGMALPALLVVWLAMKRSRSRRRCPNCSAAMKKIDEVNDNAYLTPAQDAEERLQSVDYDVWVCPQCRETDILPYVNTSKRYTNCPRCGARAVVPTLDRVVVRPTQQRPGRGERTFTCRNCGHVQTKPYNIAKLAAAAPVIIGGIGGSGGGGGFSGGSFGGGFTGGGGASGGW